MSHFYASIDESARKTVPTARGHRNGGITAHVRSWSVGVRVSASVIDDRDVIAIHSTCGSGYGSGGEYLGCVTKNDEGVIVFTPADAKVKR